MKKFKESQIIQDSLSLSPRLVYQIIRIEGEEELARPLRSLLWAGIAAGMLISFSVLGEAILRTHLPDTPSRYVFENFGYSFGFLLVILGRLQLFTENTITTVFPLVSEPTPRMFLSVTRLWAIVLSANVVGAFAAAALFAYTPAIPADLLPAITGLSEHALRFEPGEAFMRAVPAGILVAAIVWMLPQVPGSAFLLIVAFTWLIAAGDFTHIVAGSVEMWFLLLTGGTTANTAIFSFFLPVLAGNIAGGTAVFTLMAWGQVKDEWDEED